MLKNTLSAYLLIPIKLWHRPPPANERFHAISPVNSAIVLRKIPIGAGVLNSKEHQNLNPAQAMAAAHRCESNEQLMGAEHLYRRIIESDPFYHPAYHRLGLLAFRVNKLELAVELMASAIALNSGIAVYHRDRGEICRRLARLDEAAQEARAAVSVDPQDAESHYNLGLALADLEAYADAQRSYRTALALNPGHGPAWNNLGSVLEKQDNSTGAIEAYRKAIALNPNHAEALSNLGSLLSKEGALDEAKSLLIRALDLQPASVASHYQLSSMKRYAADDPHLKTLELLSENAAVLPEKERIQLYFALGKARADIKNYDQAFTAFEQGNRLRKSQLPAGNSKPEQLMTAIIEYFSREMMERRVDTGVDDPAPVFIVGMPRSGTSLVEQILSSHSAVHGAGELKDFHNIASDLFKVTPETSFVECMKNAPSSIFSDLGQQYLDKLHSMANGVQRITDKMPANFFYLGLIKLALPRAKIIHTARDPMDSCLSCYCRLFNDTMDFSYDLETLGQYYVRYHRLMEHWQQVLPAGSIMTVRYEELVCDLEGHTRAMLDYIGLPWEDACLEYYHNQRPVRTASLAQVRQPIYQSSVGGWRHYEKQLQPLLDIVGKYR
jgi:tetratricopeptide (TPR) repeat protein